MNFLKETYFWLVTWQPCHVTCPSVGVGVVGCLRSYVGGGGNVHRLSKSKMKVKVAKEKEKENKNVPRTRDTSVSSSASAFSSRLLSRRGPVCHR